MYTSGSGNSRNGLIMKKIIPVKNKSKAVRIAIEEFLRKDRLKKIDLFRGDFSFDKKILDARHHERFVVWCVP